MYFVLVLLGVTTSSIGTASLREDPESPLGLQIGQSQTIRSDEYGTESPLWLGQSARAGAEGETPLSASNDFFAQLPEGPVSAVVFFDGSALALSPWIPESMLFAAKWWLPTLLLFIGMPLWFRQMTARLRWGYLAAILIAVAPTSMWWSGRPVNTLGFVSAGCALAVLGVNRLACPGWAPRALGIGAIIASGVLLARTPTYYQPWAIVLGVPVVLSTAVYLLTRSLPWWRRLTDLGGIALSAIVWTGLLFWENWDAVQAGLHTVYPGERQSSGSALPAGQVFGATSLGWLESIGDAAPLNPSEVSSSFTVLILVVGLLAATQRWRGGRLLAAALIPMTVCAAFWLSWCLVDWGTFGSSMPLVNRVPPSRAAESVGFLGTIAFCLFMSQWRPSRRLAVPILAAGVTALVSAYGGSALQQGQLPGLTAAMIWASATIAAAVVFFLVRWPHAFWSLGIGAVAACALTATTVPIIFGLGDLRASATAQQFMTWGAQARQAGTVWASDSLDIDSLMTATGTPSLSARQQIGPDEAAWLKLDPAGEYRDMWNRGGLHIEFDWVDEPGLEFSQPAPDTVIMSGSPCTVAARIPELRRIVSSHALAGQCLREVTEIQWSGETFVVYDVNLSDG
ncbi:MAG: hypothetical protein QM626_06180 [Microbacterium sp.]|uniref:DUF7657 domain-containing protein n=1 Tax=Microbacterium sp. TaxID=51671 RepID=UPI0039E624F3